MNRLYDYSQAFDHPVTLWICVGALILLSVAPVLLKVLCRGSSDATRLELRKRYLSWLVLVPLLFVPILLGAFWTILLLCILALMCNREFSRLTGSFRNRLVNLTVIIGILLTFFAALDHWYGLFMAATPFTVAAVAIMGLATDDPKGYVQRVALGTFGYMLFGAGLGHFAYLANDANYRPILLMLIVGIQFNDVLAYCWGKLIGHRRLAPVTSPNKTLGGALGALLTTSILVASLAHFIFEGTRFDHWYLLWGLGLLVSLLGQLGDLMLSAIKRDIGVKDTGQLIPGHGGLLDRFDSTLLVAPACFHYIGYFLGVGLDQAPRIFTG